MCVSWDLVRKSFFPLEFLKVFQVLRAVFFCGVRAVVGTVISSAWEMEREGVLCYSVRGFISEFLLVSQNLFYDCVAWMVLGVFFKRRPTTKIL